ncbi:MAG: hypothetical protein ACT6FF_05160 [Methanosarcinaceae archaeon]
MKLEISDAILATVKMAGDRVLGRTAIQKLVYFLTINNIVDARYRPHYYGPYSVDIANSIQMLSSIDFITEEIETPETTEYSVPANWKRYRYSLSPDGKEIFEDIKKQNEYEYGKLSNIIEICGTTTYYNMDILSWAAKVHYILFKKGESMTYHAVIHTADSFGWKLSPTQVEKGIELLKNLNLCA